MHNRGPWQEGESKKERKEKDEKRGTKQEERRKIKRGAA